MTPADDPSVGGDATRSEETSAAQYGADGAGTSGSLIAEISLIQLMNAVLRHRRAVVAAPFVVAVLVVGWTLIQPRTFTSTTSFMPESGQRQAGRLAGLASQFGVSVPTGEVGQTPEFYADLVQSRGLLRETVVTRYNLSPESDTAGKEEDHGDLVGLLEVEADGRRLAVAKAIDKLRQLMTVSTNPETGVVDVSVTTRYAPLSRQVAERVVDLVNGFNLQRRQSQASEERAFIEDQVARAESALHAAEDSLQQFLTQHRRFENSPQLRFQQERLQRRVSLHQQVYTSLAESFEQAKIDEVRNTPVITVVDAAELPPRPDPRQLLLKGVLGLILGTMVGVFWAFSRELVAVRRAEDPDDYAEFGDLKDEALGDLRDLWRRIRWSKR